MQTETVAPALSCQLKPATFAPKLLPAARENSQLPVLAAQQVATSRESTSRLVGFIKLTCRLKRISPAAAWQIRNTLPANREWPTDLAR